MNAQLYGIYSKKSIDAGFGSIIFSTPDGGEVEVTAVISKGDDFQDYGWDDKKFVGPVVNYLHDGVKGKI